MTRAKRWARAMSAAAILGITGCGSATELRVPGSDGALALPDATSRPDATSPTCPQVEPLSTARRLAWSTCNNPNRDESCVTATDGRRICGCESGDSAQEQCGFSLVNFVGSTPVLGRALCDARTGICQCTIGRESCTCRSSSPAASCAIRTGRNCCWNETL